VRTAFAEAEDGGDSAAIIDRGLDEGRGVE
jgi:hypothetical protein